MRPVDIIVPVYNEEACIEEFHARMARLGLSSALVFVDNGSTDGTAARIARLPDVRLIRHAQNEGYGASVRDAMLAGTADRIVIIDGDLEYPPEVVPAVLQALDRHPVVYTSRFVARGRVELPLFRRLGNRAVSGLYNALFRQHVTDLLTGCKGFRRGVVTPDALHADGFEHSIEFGVLFALGGQTIAEVPVAYVPRTRGTSKMRHVPEAARMVAALVRYWVRYVALGRSVPHGA